MEINVDMQLAAHTHTRYTQNEPFGLNRDVDLVIHLPGLNI